MINRVQMNSISFKAYKAFKVPKDELLESPAIHIIRNDDIKPTCIEMYAELDRLKEEIAKADSKLARIRKSDYSADETKLMNKIGRMKTHQMLLEQAIKQRFEEEIKKHQEREKTDAPN